MQPKTGPEKEELINLGLASGAHKQGEKKSAVNIDKEEIRHAYIAQQPGTEGSGALHAKKTKQRTHFFFKTKKAEDDDDDVL